MARSSNALLCPLILEVLRDSTNLFVGTETLRSRVASLLRDRGDVQWSHNTFRRYMRRAVPYLARTGQIKVAFNQGFALKERHDLWLVKERARVDNSFIKEHESLEALQAKVNEAFDLYKNSLLSATTRPSHLNHALTLLTDATKAHDEELYSER